MQGKTPLPYNTVAMPNVALAADNPSDALSEVSIQQQHTDTTASGTLPTLIARAIPGKVNLPPTVSA